MLGHLDIEIERKEKKRILDTTQTVHKNKLKVGQWPRVKSKLIKLLEENVGIF